MTAFHEPPESRTPSGEQRRVGIELEYAGLDIDRAAEALAEELGADIDASNPFCIKLTGHELGDFRLEVDARILKERKHLEWLGHLGLDPSTLDVRAALESALRSTVSVVVPHELVTPPIPLDQLDLAESLREALRRLKARGTGDSLFYGFGLHMNPELSDHTARSLRNHLRAFVLLRDWIVDQSDIDWSRRIGPHIRAWPEPWIELLMHPDYQPNRPQLADDYARLVGSRNHELDLLPALVELEGRGLLEHVEEPELVQPRPAFHYRLPNCHIDEPDWRLAGAWNHWVQVERLAADTDQLEQLCEAWQDSKRRWLSGLTGEWRRRMHEHLAARNG
ncbi:amidoligase family protein [Pseudomarimonas salicorniae]|uniref:Amidoligase family protein n=1 Tax=Pseudomarimonas salicorniae TaxID=2933270 RepID=A0ABT0GI19_9GAMM|nr:amidoligase family protein [Lysobacter sp. CAU 1642]MCK7594200.1 amidoligase family protein [Lysobacter sp. CAU 1642]